MTYVHGGYGASQANASQHNQFQPSQAGQTNHTNQTSFPSVQQFQGGFPISNIQSLTQGFLGSINDGNFNGGGSGPLFIQTGGGKGGKKGQGTISILNGYGFGQGGGQNIGQGNNQGGPLFIQTGGGKGGKKGQGAINILNGYGFGNQITPNFGGQNGGPILLQTGGGKGGGKKGQQTIALLGGYGPQPQPGSNNVNNFYQPGYQPAPQAPTGFNPQPTGPVNNGQFAPYEEFPGNNNIDRGSRPGRRGGDFGGDTQTQRRGGNFGGDIQTQQNRTPNFGNGSPFQQNPGVNFGNNFPAPQPQGNIYINNPGLNFGNFGNQQHTQFPSGGYQPILLQTGGGKGGKKGVNNIVLAGGYGLGNQGFGDFNTGGPLLLQTGGGKGGKKGVGNISFVGGYGINGFPGNTTTNNFYQTPGQGFNNPQNVNHGFGHHFGNHNVNQGYHSTDHFSHHGNNKYA